VTRARTHARNSKKIEHYGKLSSLIYDKTVLENLQALIERYQAEKSALHAEEE
jgi:hypothetical protein